MEEFDFLTLGRAGGLIHALFAAIGVDGYVPCRVFVAYN